MSNRISTIKPKWQVTIPAEVRNDFLLKVGQRIAWEVHGDKLVGRCVRSMSELSGSLRLGSAATRGQDLPEDFAEAALARDDRIARQKS